jgi:predicted metal-dependent hydrolase
MSISRAMLSAMQVAEDIKSRLVIRRRQGMRHMWIRVLRDARIVLSFSPKTSDVIVERFIQKHEEWIRSQLERIESLPPLLTPSEQRTEYKLYKEQARTFAKERVEYYCGLYGFSHRRIAIKNSCTRWGSCSRSGNLNFHYQLIFLPPELAEYLIVHEVCHLQEFNHSERFWALVAKQIKNYAYCRRALKKWRLQAPMK